MIAVFAVLFAFMLTAASPGPSILGTPVLIVYSFSVNGGDITREAGSRLAVAIATQIANLGGVDVKPAPAGVDRPNFLEAARGVGADYYVAGYVTPLGDGVSLVEQLVSTQTGIVVYSNSAQVRTFADATGQGDILHDALLRHQSRNLGGYAAPPPSTAATPTPAPGSAAQANIGKLFGHRQKRGAAAATPAPSSAPAAAARATGKPAAPPSPVAALAAAPSRPSPSPPSASFAAPPAPAVVAAAPRGSAFAILPIGGSAEDERRSFTGAAIRNDVIANHRRVTLAGEVRETACKDQSTGTLVGGNIATRSRTILGQRQTIATLELLAYDCAGNVVYRKTFANDARGSWRYAVNGVVADAVAAFLKEPLGTPHG